MPIGIILLACFRLSFEEERVDCSHKDFGEGATITTIIGSKGDELGERTSKKFFNGRRRYRHGIQHRITNLIPKTIALFALKFLMGEFGGANWNLLGSKGTGEFVSLTETATLAFPNLLVLVKMLRIRFIGGVGISNRSSIRSNWSIIRFNKWNVGWYSLIWSIEWYN